MKKNLLALGIILMSALTFTACSDDEVLLVFLITIFKLVQQHLSYSKMLIRHRMVLVSVMHKT